MSCPLSGTGVEQGGKFVKSTRPLPSEEVHGPLRCPCPVYSCMKKARPWDMEHRFRLEMANSKVFCADENKQREYIAPKIKPWAHQYREVYGQ